jgi:hypothetical protein
MHKHNTTTTSTTTRNGTILNPKKRSLSYGINKYPDPRNNLQGCVNDAKDWFDVLTNIYGFQGQMLLDSQATQKAIIEALGNMIADSKPGDKLALTGSSHGTSVPDGNGDEPDGKDEAVCAYDSYIIDDTLRAIISKLNPEVSLTIVSDSCFSGTVTREFLSSMSEPKYMKPRYLPSDDNVVESLSMSLPTRKRVFYAEDNMKEILLSGCNDHQYSYDAYIGGSYRGAMSYYATKVIRANPNQTYAQFYASLSKELPNSQYPQSPCLEGSVANKNKPLFT